jgi:hypothetical protein
LIIFTHASDMKEYAVRTVIQARDAEPEGEGRETVAGRR